MARTCSRRFSAASAPRHQPWTRLAGGLAALGLTALACCSPPPDHKAQPQARVASTPAQTTAAPPLITPPPPNSSAANATPAIDPRAALPPAGQAIDQASFEPDAAASAGPATYDPRLVKAEVLLDRAGFSPGAVDGKSGSNLKRAIAAFAQARGLASTGELDAEVLQALVAADPAPVAQVYRITAADEAGPFIGQPPKDYRLLAALPALAYSDPEQALAERFHMSRVLLEAMNPGVDFTQAGQDILVAAPRLAPRDFQAARIEVDKTANQLRAYDADGRLLAVYPASVGSAERPAPSGQFEVTAVAPNPAYFYDPARLTFTPQGATGRLRIAPGPNNPVGLTWIALSIPTYGIHGAPDPTTIGKRQSHGCVRLTNWDAVELGRAVRKGVTVDFVGSETRRARTT